MIFLNKFNITGLKQFNLYIKRLFPYLIVIIALIEYFYNTLNIEFIYSLSNLDGNDLKI